MIKVKIGALAMVMMGLTNETWAQPVQDENAPPAWSPGIPLYDQDGARLQFDAKAMLGLFAVSNAGFGAGTNPRGSGGVRHHPQWMESYVKPGLSGEIDLGGDTGLLYGGVMGIHSDTLGDGDAGAVPTAGSLGTEFTRGNTAHTDLERLYLGWRSDRDPATARTASGVDLSVGRQEFMIGDGFLIGDGNSDFGRDGAYYLGGRLAWSNSVLLRAAWMPLRTDLFVLRSDKDTGNTYLHGVNVEAVRPELGTVGLAAMRVSSANPAIVAPQRDGMRVLDLHAQGTPIPALFLSAEYVNEANGSAGKSLQADAWYGEVGYSFSVLPWSPTLSYRYSHFSGDDVSTGRSEAFDPLFYAAGRGWGTWFQGEIAGQYMLFNSNENVHQLHLKAKPLETTGIGVIGYLFRYDQRGAVAKASGGQGVTSDRFGSEIDLYVDWAPRDWLAISAVYGRLLPDTGGAEAYGASRDSDLFEVMTTVTF